MSEYRVISADSHIVEPPDLYENRIEPKFRDRAPRIERHRTRTGREYDAWYFEGPSQDHLGQREEAVPVHRGERMRIRNMNDIRRRPLP
jgi:hypothetical protein